MPETKMLELGWPLSEKAQSDIDDKKRKPSKEIRVDAMRDAVEFTQRTSARGRGKAVLIFPAEDMNGITANALLKTLEEPPGDVKFVLATESAHQLLPTIRSRCLTHTMVWPDVSQSEQWLIAQGLSAPHAQQLLKATGGRPQDALEFSQSGRDPSVWAAFPKAMSKGDTAFVKEWSGPELIDALHKLCHDVMAVSVGSEPRFFLAADLPKAPTIEKTSSWSQALSQSRRTMDHPYNAGLMQEALVSQAQTALH
jgi:DNA polymerase-3 subunit delta'